MKFYITTAIDYPNAKPHMGHAYEKTIADCIARWHVMTGDDVFFLTGTDEHGLKLAKAAEVAGKKPQEFVDEMVEQFEKMDAAMNVSFSKFIRTTDVAHDRGAKRLWETVFKAGDIYLSEYKGLYCPGCEEFKLERDLVDGKCPAHNAEPERFSEEAYFFRMSKYADRLKKHILSHKTFILPASRRNEILKRLEEGLKDLCVSRKSLTWGISLPNDKEHVMYVWFDALSNYLTGIGYPDKEMFRKYWPADVHVIGKDIAWFHCVIWPSMLMSAGLALPETVHVHGFLTINGEKMSKSRGIAADPIAVAGKYAADALRYHLLRDVVAGEDGDFNEQALIERANADLADGLGNLLQRTVVLIERHFGKRIPQPSLITPAEEKVINAADTLAVVMERHMRSFEWHHALEKLFSFVHECNKYINDAEPWKKTDDKERLGTILYTLTECLRIISILAWPFMPQSAEQIAKQLGQERGTMAQAKFSKSTSGLVKRGVLFKKIGLAENTLPENAKSAPAFAKANLKVAIINEVQQHPHADKLYVLKIGLGTEKRQLVAGIKAYYAPDELQGKHIIMVSNLKPAKLRGIESQGMLLAADKDGVVAVLEAPNSPPGAQVFVEGIEPGTETITIEEFLKMNITTKDHHAMVDGMPLRTAEELVHAPIDDCANVR